MHGSEGEKNKHVAALSLYADSCQAILPSLPYKWLVVGSSPSGRATRLMMGVWIRQIVIHTPS